MSRLKRRIKMDRTEFIQECAMRNLAAMFAAKSHWGTICADGVERAYQAAKVLADKLYGEDMK